MLFEMDINRNWDKIGNKWEKGCILCGKSYQKWEKLAFFPILQYDKKTRKTRGMINTGLNGEWE
ncbi:hypothetical protein DW886_19500 [Enterocloster aldenensis]|nr:hypothetical protein DW886_19500 [Enterocloster aldenensis]